MARETLTSPIAVTNIVINGQRLKTLPGQTVLQAATAAGIKIPLSAIIRACRLKARAAFAWWKSRSSGHCNRPALSRFPRDW